MFLVRVILLSLIVFTVTSAALCDGESCSNQCCGQPHFEHCLGDCLGFVCTSDSHCGDQCCIGDNPLYQRFCGACHKTRSCEFFIGNFCSEKCCGINSRALLCRKTCDGISCLLDDHCDGECCVGEVGSKKCAPCLCTRNSDCTTNRCIFGKCALKTRQSDRRTSPEPTTTAVTTTHSRCRRNHECTTNCCQFGKCTSKRFCPSSDRPTTPQWTTTAVRTTDRYCTRNLDCPTRCCKYDQCLPHVYCSPTDNPSTKASSGTDLKKVIVIPVLSIVFIIILVVLLYCYLIRGKKGNPDHRPPQSTRPSEPPPVTFYSDTNHGEAQSSGLPMNFYSDNNHGEPQRPLGPPPPYVYDSTEPVHYNNTDRGTPQSTRASDTPPPYMFTTAADQYPLQRH